MQQTSSFSASGDISLLNVPFPARRAMQDAIYEKCILPGDNEWTTFSDSCAVAEIAAEALVHAGWKVVPLDER